MRKLIHFILMLLSINIYGFESNMIKNSHPFKYKGRSVISVGFGPAGYIGDLVPFEIYQSIGFKKLNFSGSLEYQRFIAKKISLKTSLSYLRISADENDYDSCSSYRPNYIRNLHFRNDIKEIGILIQYEFKDRFSREFKNNIIFPYLAVGFNLINHNPKAIAPKKTLLDQNNWIPLNDLAVPTEGILYKKTTGSIPIELGIAIKYNSNFDFGFNFKYRYSFTDYLDDVSDNRSFNISNTMFSVRSNELIAPFNNKLRSNILDNDIKPFYMAGNDLYYSINFKVIYHFNRGIVCYD